MYKISFSYRPSNSLWGRFGGGWQWKVGFQIGPETLLISLLICELRFDKIDNKIKQILLEEIK